MKRDEAEWLLDELITVAADPINKELNSTDALNAARAAVLDAMTRATPPGWKLVPVEPTNEMLEAMWGYRFTSQEEAFEAVDLYATMLAAAPEAPK